ncbi:hypothetical protein OAS92_04460 [Candidatus Pelagibacter sp.]|jgi:hypothetical protein|nr:hypothetical protein [Candidatus Pelagibacter sp.]|tara:strand:+ start:296 stop:778 length:483 start_codon:yes stop_codon:yes gene_type:complete
MTKVWKIIKPTKYKNVIECIKALKKKKIYISPWIEDIVKNKKNKLIITNQIVYLFRVKVSFLGFSKPTQLKNIYKKLKQKGFMLVPPDIAFRSRLQYPEQKKGEWLRFATPMNSLIDSDGVPHLPKIGKALNCFFIETYWSYSKAIFHPHNEFVVMKNDI